MSKDLRNNERYFKELADNHKPVPPPLVWDKIEQVLDKDKDKRRLLPILWIFGVLLVGAITIITIRGEIDVESTIAEKEASISDYQQRKDPNFKDSKTVDIDSINGVEQGQNANILGTTSTATDNQEEHKVDSEKSKSEKSKSEKPKRFITQQPQLNSINTSSVNKSLNTNTNTSNTNVTTINSDLSTIITKENVFRPRVSTPSTFEDRRISQVASLQRLQLMPRPLETRMPLPDPSENLTDIPHSVFNNRASFSSPWFVELGGGIGGDLSSPVLTNPTQGELRLNTESKWYSWSTSFQLGYQFDNHWYTTIGIDLNQTKNKFDFWRRDVSSLQEGVNQNLQITSGDFFNTGEIRYTFADVGLSLGKRVNIDKWHFSLEGGPIFNVLFNANGKVQVGDSEFSRLEEQGEYFNTQVGLGARFSAMLDYPISDQLWMSVGPMYHQYFNTVSSDVNPLKERNAILQVKARMRYHF